MQQQGFSQGSPMGGLIPPLLTKNPPKAQKLKSPHWGFEFQILEPQFCDNVVYYRTVLVIIGLK